jgi:hypothetical protein
VVLLPKTPVLSHGKKEKKTKRLVPRFLGRRSIHTKITPKVMKLPGMRDQFMILRTYNS